MARKEKGFHEYLIADAPFHISQSEYINSPATAFLSYTSDAKDAIGHCVRKFKNSSGSLSRQSTVSMQHILSSMLPSVMGHFETFQKYLFAGIFENTSFLKDFSINNFFQKLTGGKMSIDIIRLSAYRGYTAPVGMLLADNLSGWHDPDIVNKYFHAFGLNSTLFSNDDCKKLKILWQLRHSIVHTGCTITHPDAQKVPELQQLGGKNIVFESQFIFEVARKMHPLIELSTHRMKTSFDANMIQGIGKKDKKRIDKLFEVKSRTAIWLTNPT